jgi:molybdopterin-guanine dinucleotide biosynthesis protein A
VTGRPRPGLPAASAIVLAGGRSSRFGRDKLAEPLDGRPLLAHAVEAVAVVVRDVVVIGRPGDSAAPARVGRVAVRHAPDAEPFGGPLVALRRGLELVREPLALIVGGDMPRLAPDVLALLLRTLASSEGMAGVCLVHRGRRQPLPMAVRVGATTAQVEALVGAGERSLQALLAATPTRDLAEVEWRALDPAAETLRDVDRPEDLPGPA